MLLRPKSAAVGFSLNCWLQEICESCDGVGDGVGDDDGDDDGGDGVGDGCI